MNKTRELLDGWKLVPIRPTIEMVEAGYEASLGEPDRSARARVFDQYKAMLAATPEQAVQQCPACEGNPQGDNDPCTVCNARSTSDTVSVPRELLERLIGELDDQWDAVADLRARLGGKI